MVYIYILLLISKSVGGTWALVLGFWKTYFWDFKKTKTKIKYTYTFEQSKGTVEISEKTILYFDVYKKELFL
jgi:hypothetical protein